MQNPFAPAELDFISVSPKLKSSRYIHLLAWLLPLFAAALGMAIFFFRGPFEDLSFGWRVFAFGPAILLLVLLLWMLILIPRQVRNLAYAEGENELYIRSGAFFRHLTVVPYGRMQFVDLSEGPLDRFFGIASVQLHTASAASDASIPGLPRKSADELRRRLTELGESQMAGL